MALPLLHAADMLSFGLLLAIVAAIGAFMPPYAASQRVILPELVGEDVTTMSRANSLIEGGTAAALIGPALAGILIPLVGAPNVLYIDAATYLVAFLLVLLFVPRPKTLRGGSHGWAVRRRPVRRPRCVHGLARGHHRRVRLLRRRAVGGVAGVFFEGDGPRVAGLFYSALGAGALIGTIIAVGLIPRTQPLRLAAGAILGVVPLGSWA